MGMFDDVKVDSQFRCSEGHDLSEEDFQSKDFGETMGLIAINGDKIHMEEGGYGYLPKLPLLGRFSVYGNCSKCPAFVQADTFNLIPCGVEFELEVVDDVIRSIKRTSQSTAEFIESTPKEEWMRDCYGPMSHAEALKMRGEGLRNKESDDE